MLMDNGQHIRQDSFAITPGVGNTSPEYNSLPPQGNLNSNSFEYQNNDHKTSEMGNVALNSPEIPQYMPDISTNTEQLGQIVTLPTPPLMDSTLQSEESTLPRNNQEETVTDSVVIKHFADGKVDKGDVKYLETRIEALDPANLVDFVDAVRHEILNGKQEAA